jgi:enoyl-CoA hydratase/carnithine racemase
MTTTGSVVPASSPMLNGLFAEILPSPDQVLPRALELATDIAQNTSSVSTYLMREMIWRNPGSAEGAHLLDSEIMYQLYDKKDKEEGFKSFLEKRPPNFQGTLDDDMASCLPWWTPVDVQVQKSNKPKL